MADFEKAKFKYFARFDEFKWIPYLTTQYPIHENLIQILFSNFALASAAEGDKDLYRIVAINTFIMGMPIRITQRDVVETFGMLDSDYSDEHEGR